MSTSEQQPQSSTQTVDVLGSAEKNPQGLLLGKGLDIGTANIVAAHQSQEDGISIRLERNAFLDIDCDVYSKDMLTKLKVPYVQHNGKLLVIGDSAFELANVFSRETRRPMSDGLISPDEVDAMPMIQLIIKKVLGEPQVAGENCCFSVPAESIDADNNVVYHQGLFEGMIQKMGYTGRAINEGHAVVFSDMAAEDFTGIGISFGGGMVNACVTYRTIPALSFSVCRGGDWIDKNVAAVLGVKRSRATMIKEQGVRLMSPQGREQEAVAIYYRNLLNYTLQNIKARFENSRNMPTFSHPIPIVCSGGTSMVGDFVDCFRDEFEKIKFPIPISQIRLATEPLNTVAKGCLVAAAIAE